MKKAKPKELVRLIQSLFVAGAFVATHANAVDQPLPTIHVVADEDLDKIPGSAVVIDSEQLDLVKPISTQDILKTVPGIHAVETDGYGFYPRISIRGIGSNMSRKVLILEDGAPVALGPYTNPSAYYSPPIERMERIEVLKGSGSLAHGPSTIGGAINYITRDPSKNPGGLVQISTGTDKYRNILAEYGHAWDGKHASISLLKKDGDGWRSSPFDVTDIVAKTGVALNSQNYVGIKYTNFHQRSNHTYLGLTQYEYDSAYKMNKAKLDKMMVDRHGIDVNHVAQIDPNVTWKNLIYWNTAKRDWWRQSHSQAGSPVVTTMGSTSDGRLRQFDVFGIDSRLYAKHQLGGIHQDFEAGLRYHTERMKNVRARATAVDSYVIDDAYTASDYVNGYKENDVRRAEAWSLFAQNRFYVGDKTTLTPGFRVESYELKRQNLMNDASGGTHHSELIPGIGLTHQLDGKKTLYAGVHKGYSPPLVADAISADGTAENLGAEISTNYEIGLRGQWSRGRYEVTAFRLDFDNQLVSKSASGGSGTQLTNAGKTLNQGVELSSELNVGYGWGLSGNYTWLPTAKLTSTRIMSGIDRNGNRLTYAPKHLLNTQLSYKKGAMNVYWGLQYVSSQFADLENTVAASPNGRTGLIPAYMTMNVGGRYAFDKASELFWSVRNLADKKYVSSRAPEGIFPGMGRAMHVGLKTRF